MNGLALALDELRALALSPKLVWRHFVTGVQIHRLWGAPHTRSGALLRYAPGSKVPRHRHEEYPAGTHVINQPGSSHSVSSPEGCVVFVVWERPNTFLDDSKA